MEFGGENGKESSETGNGEENTVVNNSESENANVAGTVTKRKRIDSDDEETQVKRLKVSEIDLDKVRRSPRLSKRIEEVWNGRRKK